MKTVQAWLIPWDGQYNGPYPIPSSEQSYRDHLRLIDAVLPAHGGVLQPSTGEWTRQPSVDNAFSTYLMNEARVLRQQYVPIFGLWPGSHGPYGQEGEAEFLELLQQPERWPGVADGLVRMAQTSADAPWNGMVYDYFGGGGRWPDESMRAHERFCRTVSETVRAAGMRFGVSFRGIIPTDESWSPSLDVFREITDFFEYYMFVYWDKPFSPSPFWWHRASIENALRHGFEPGQIYLGLLTNSWYYDFEQGFNYWITHDQAMQIVRENGARVRWVEDHAAGLIREKYAAIGRAGHLWIEDGDTVRARLALVDKYGLGGIMLFVLGSEAESVWDAIAEWKRPKRTRPAGMSSRIGANGGYLVPSGRAIAWPTRP